MHSGMADEMIRMAVEQFLPSAAAGGLITLVLLRMCRGAVDAAGPLANDLQPGRVFVVPFFAAADDGCRSVVSAHRAGLRCAWGRARAFAVGDGRSVRRGQLLVAGILLSRAGGEDERLSESASEGRFAYEGLDRVIHERARLSVLTSLITNPKGLAFGDLKQLCALTDGNLSRHLRVLERARWWRS